MSADLERIIQAMSNPEIYPHHPESVQVVQTHISVVFIAGDLVYKIKKPLNLGFLDFTSLEKRIRVCRREVELNSRFSEGIYLDVVPVHVDDKGINLEERGRQIDAAVLMKKIPLANTMIRMLEKDRVTPEILDRVADRIAYFHSLAARGPEISVFGSLDVLSLNVEENFSQTEPYVGRTISRPLFDAILRRSTDFLKNNRSLFEERVRGGFIRDCHGDLHLDHVVVLDPVILVDCIEFNDRFRYGDTAADLAFLLMDLDLRGYPAYSRRIARRYSQTSGDTGFGDVVDFYKSYRAYVRGKVLGFTLDESEVSSSDKESAVRSASDYFSLSLSYLMPPPRPALIIMWGLTGSGKSFLAGKLGSRTGIDSIRSDVVRKELFGMSPLEHRLDKYGEGIYTSNATERTYEALLARARAHLERGESVIADASFLRRDDRARARSVATETKAQFHIIQCYCPDEIARIRLGERLEKGGDPSEGRWEIFLEQKERLDPFGPEELPFVHKWDSTTDPNPFLRSLVHDLMTPRLSQDSPAAL